ncbi:hypothetical protein [Futiania mangrovi]|uniref:Uncharacterized protein n=1 Tax=Futiania mangrovi TaxID=2959716 RepID=A0A9J6P8W4_9PROT|nr:hypothetical protein [Futiania mangrovii]MCP1336236.1 hypothetical protein [Futiania mangrovii]
MSGGEGQNEESLRKLGREFRSYRNIPDDESRIAAVTRLVSDSARQSLKFGEDPPVFSKVQHDCLVDLAILIVVSLDEARRKPKRWWQWRRWSEKDASFAERFGIILTIISICVALFAIGISSALWFVDRSERQRLETQLEAPNGKAAPSPIQSSPPRVSMPRTVVAE